MMAREWPVSLRVCEVWVGERESEREREMSSPMRDEIVLKCEK